MKIERQKVLKKIGEVVPYVNHFWLDGIEYIKANTPNLLTASFGVKVKTVSEGGTELCRDAIFLQNDDEVEIRSNYATVRIDSTKTGDLIEIIDEEEEDLFAIVYRIGKDDVEFTFLSGSLKGERGSRDKSQLVRVFSDPKIVI